MLVLSRKTGERIQIGDNITIVVNRVAGNRVTIGIEAPNNVHIVRGELRNLKETFAEAEEAAPSRSTPALTLSGGNGLQDYVPRHAK